MKSHTLLAAACLATSAAPALAEDFAGFYAGAALSHDSLSGETDYSTHLDANGTSIGLFAGYNWQFGNLVVGPELVLRHHNASGNEGNYFDPFTANRSHGVKARVGYAFGNALPYLALGAVHTKFSADHDNGSGDWGHDTATGRSIAIGADWLIAEKTLVRFEIERVDYRDDRMDWSGHTHGYSLDDTSVSLGLAYRF